MVPVLTYKTFWEFIKTEVSGIGLVRVAFEIEDFTSILRDLDLNSVVLLAVMPGSESESSSHDEYEEIDNVYVYLLKKSNPGDLTYDESINEMAALQVIMKNIKHKLIMLAGDYMHQCSNPVIGLMRNIIIGTMRTDPEYNLMGCNGYGLTFKLKTSGV